MRKFQRSVMFFLLTVVLTSFVVNQFNVQAVSIIFADGFESGNFNSWTSSAGGMVQQIIKHHGVYAAQFSGTWQQLFENIASSSLVYGRIYVYFSNLPSDGNVLSLISFCDGEAYVPDVVVGIKNDGGIMKWGAVWDTYGGGPFAASPSPTTNVWYCVELKLIVTEGVGYSYEVWVDGASILSQTRNYDAARAVDTFIVGGWDKSEALVNYIDCVVVSDAYIGPESPSTSSSIFRISANSAIHDDYGLTYPVTYEFRIPTSVTAAKCYYRFSNAAAWSELPTKTKNDFFNGIEAARFDYLDHKAFISIAFSADTDEIYLKFTDGNGNEINCEYNAISRYYDNRRAVVTVSADDWDGNYERETAFIDACNVFQDANIWLTVGVVTTGHYDEGAPPNYATIQTQLNEGFVEVAAHSRTHAGLPYDYDSDYDSEIGGCKNDIIGNLTLPALYRKGETEYVWGWIEPGGASDATARQTLGTYNYLADRAANGDYIIFPTWDSENGLYNRAGVLYGDETTLQDLNDNFDYAYSGSLIYAMYFHPSAYWLVGGGNWENGVIAQHVDYIKNKKDVWYVGFGALYAYHFVQERGIIQVEPEVAQTEYTLTMITQGQGSVVPGNQTFSSGTVVDIQAIAAADWTFSGWSGDLNREEQLITSSEIVSDVLVPEGSVITSLQAAVYWDGTYLHVWYGVATDVYDDESIYYTKASKPFTSWSTPVQVIDRDDGIRDPTIFIEDNTIYLFLQCWDEQNYHPVRLYKINETADYTEAANYVYVGEVIDLGGAGTYDEYMVASPCIVKISNTYYLMYEAIGDDGFSIGRAKTGNIESLPWTKDGPLRDKNGDVVINPTSDTNAIVPDTFADQDTLFLHYYDGAHWNVRYINGDFQNNSVTLSEADINPEDGYSDHVDIAHIGLIDGVYYFLMQSSGDLRLYKANTTVTMDGNKVVTATFTQDTYTITASVEDVGGTIDPSGAVLVTDGQNITFNITPDLGYHISDVIVDGTSMGPQSSFTFYDVQEDHTITAVFAADEYTLTIIIVGGGKVTMDKTGPYHLGDVVRLTAVPNAGWSFSVWSGALTGSVNPADLTITGDMTVTATFIKKTYTITASVEDVGGTIDPSGAVLVTDGQNITFNITPDLGYHISDVIVDGTSMGPQSSFTFYDVQEDHTITAVFAADEYTLTIIIVGGGKVTKNPNKASYSYGETVLLTAIPNRRWVFSGWSGDLTETANPATIVMDSSKTVYVTFTKISNK